VAIGKSSETKKSFFQRWLAVTVIIATMDENGYVRIVNAKKDIF